MECFKSHSNQLLKLLQAYLEELRSQVLILKDRWGSIDGVAETGYKRLISQFCQAVQGAPGNAIRLRIASAVR